AELFADAGPAHVIEALARAYEDRVEPGEGYRLATADWQRRMLAVVDVGADRFYAVDWCRLSGGHGHWWAFHAQEGEFTTAGLSLARQESGTLAGPSVGYGNEKWLEEHGCTRGVYGWSGPMFALAHLYNVEHGQPAGVWSADWALREAD